MNQALPGSENPVIIPGRGGTSPIGTSSPNSGGAANTNSSYAVGAFTSGVNEQAAAVTYSVQNTDYGGYIVFQTSSAITITLNQAVGTNFTTTILNIGAGAITLTPNGGLLVNGVSSLTLASGQGVQVFFANRAWQAYAGTTVVQVVPTNTPAVSHEWLASYNSTTGAFTQTQPAYLDISGTPTLPVNTPATTGEYVTGYNSSTGAFSVSATPGISVTINPAALTALGTQGSMTFTGGLLTAQVAAT